ncbi:MAG: Nif11-like leader peptide family natural product precursor [Syntrophomonas sp.]|nr:Nif11-like leader peptide family natural product precursor [Syntrophomonas sp.]
MSIESARLFIEKLKNDQEFAQKALACTDTEERMRFEREAGFDFTASELKMAGQELSDNDLDSVSGGNELSQIYFKLKDLHL